MAELIHQADGIEIWHGDNREVAWPASPDLVLTDPPYGIGFDFDHRRFGSGWQKANPNARTNNRTWDPVVGDAEPFDPGPLLELGRAVLWGANYYVDRLPAGGRWLVWNKRDCVATPALTADGEMAWHNCGGQPVRIFNWFWQGRYRKGETGTALHPAQKPVALMRWILETFTEPGQLVFDPFMGSGPVAQAAHQLGRRYVGIEVVRSYAETAVRRLQQAPMFT